MTSTPTSVEWAVVLARIIVCVGAVTVLGRPSRREFRIDGRVTR